MVVQPNHQRDRWGPYDQELKDIALPLTITDSFTSQRALRSGPDASKAWVFAGALDVLSIKPSGNRSLHETLRPASVSKMADMDRGLRESIRTKASKAKLLLRKTSKVPMNPQDRFIPSQRCSHLGPGRLR